MRLARTISLALALLAALVLAAEAALESQREMAHAREDSERDHRLLGAALGSTIVRAWQLEGREEALLLLEQANQGQHGVRIRWVWLEGSVPASRRPQATPAQLAPLAHAEPVSLVLASGGTRWLVSYIPFRLEGRLGGLELSEDLRAMQAQARTSLVGNTLAALAIAIVFLLAALWLGRHLVGRPVSRLVEMARRVGGGDLEARVRLPRQDELGELAEAMNQMTQGLASTRSQLATELERRVAMLEQLRHADRLTTVGKLAAGVAHELGTPLNVVSGRAHMVASGEAEGEEARECGRIVEQQVQHMTGIIRQLLDFARRRPPQRAPEEVADLFARALSLLAPMAARRQVTLTAGPTEALTVQVDAGGLQQVLTNLVVNALQACAPGDSVHLAAQRVRARPPADLGEGEQDWVRLDVEDTGSGIAPEQLPRIFEPFFTTKDVGEGTGLGLAVAYGLVRDHGGWLEVHSTPGRGSLFSVYLPWGEAT